MDLILTNLAPNRTASIQLYQRGTNTAVGSPIVGSRVDYTYTFPGVSSTGDYDCELIGFTSPIGSRFPVRDGIAYDLPWSIVDATIAAVPPTPSPITGMCNLLVSTTQSGSRVWARLADDNNTADQVLIGQQVVQDITDVDGDASLLLIQYGQFTAGGTYRVRVADSNRFITHNVLVRMPNTSSANLEDLTPL